MDHTLSPAPHAVQAALSYLAPTSLRPVSYAFEPPPGEPWENCAYEARPTCIADARRGMAPHIDREGFELREARTRVRDFLDDDEVCRVYHPESAELALAVTGAEQAHVFDHLVRRREADRAALTFGRQGRGQQAAANGRIHNDYTEASGRRRLALLLGDEAAARVRRHAIVNIWRSIRGVVRDTPLAVCDARSVGSAELVASDVRYPKRTGEIYLMTHAASHRWSYFPLMDRGEALVFKQFDSQREGVARFTPHAAFDDPATPADAPLRESIELRCLVTWS